MISQGDFTALQALLLRRSGMALGSDKLYLVAGRLGPVAVKFGFRGVLELMANLHGAPPAGLVDAVVEAMATHESLFFRDGAPFDYLSNILLPDFVRRTGATRTVRIWSAACSTGQEPYSIAMVLREAARQFPGLRFEILATDFVPSVLEKARWGAYSQFEVDRGVSRERLARHFERYEDRWRLRSDVLAMVQFQQHNLLDPAAGFGMFDLILCRNVLIYFDVPTKERVVSNVLKQLNAGGCAIFGAADVTVSNRSELRSLPGLSGGYTAIDNGAAKVA